MTEEPLSIKTARQCTTKYIASVIRDAMEQFHIDHLTDEEMKKLNPILRNAVYSALYAYDNRERSEKAKRFVEYHLSMIPEYWEDAELLKYLRE